MKKAKKDKPRKATLQLFDPRVRVIATGTVTPANAAPQPGSKG